MGARVADARRQQGISAPAAWLTLASFVELNWSAKVTLFSSPAESSGIGTTTCVPEAAV
jgi:hypothetical protein